MTEEAPSPSPLPLPEVIGKRYRIVSRIGVGGMGVVYKAIDLQLNRPVAVKALEDRRWMLPGAVTKLRSEAMLAASLDHPYICKVYELVETVSNSFIVMEFVEGETLASMLKRGNLPLSATLQFGREIAEGLANAHKNGLVHRDVKPSNVMVTTNGHVKLLDFGVAGEDVESTPTDHTRTVSPVPTLHAGTPHYMAPEQASGQPVTSRADLFSLGVVLYQCLTGLLPFSGTTTFDYMRHVMQSPPRRLDRIAPDTPADLVDLIESCLEKTPALRPDSAEAVVSELRRLSDSLTSTGGAIRTAREASHNRRWKLVAGVAAGVAALVIAWQALWPKAVTNSTWQRRPFVTSPAAESNSRVSPDGQWVSFISTSGGQSQVMVQQVDAGEARPLTLTGGTPVSQEWSPDGKQLACVVTIGASSILGIYPAFFGGTPVLTLPLPQAGQIDLLLWKGRTVYFEVRALAGGISLQRLELDGGGEPVNISESWKLAGTLRSAAVRPDGRAAAVIVLANGQEDLWTIDLDGSNARQLTNDKSFERSPVWSGRGDRILVQSNRGGQLDVWEVDAMSGAFTELASGEMEKIPESTSGDGSTISFRRMSQEARLWLWPLSGSGGQQLTQDALSDYSSAFNGHRVVFQRSQPTPSSGYTIIDAKLFAAPFDGKTMGGPAQSIAEGYAPTLSSNGQWLAYLRPGEQPARSSVLMRNLETGSVTTLSRSAALPTFSSNPVDWGSNILTWSHAGSDFYFVDQSDAAEVRRMRMDSATPGRSTAETVARSRSKDELIRDLQLTADDRRLGYLTVSRGELEVHAVDLATGTGKVLATLPSTFTGTAARGWLDSSLVIVRRTVSHDDFTSDLEILLLAADRPPVKVGTLTNVFLGTTRLHSAARVLLATQSERGVHNVIAFSFDTRTTTPVTRNTLAGVTFSGFVPVGAGFFLGTREERGQDIWLIQASTTPRPGTSAGR